MRAPPHFSEELHPEEIVQRPCRHPWLGAIALVATMIAVGMLLRAATDHRTGPTADRAVAAQPRAESSPGAGGPRRLAAGRAP